MMRAPPDLKINKLTRMPGVGPVYCQDGSGVGMDLRGLQGSPQGCSSSLDMAVTTSQAMKGVQQLFF